MHREPYVGFNPGSPGSRPGPKAGAKPLRHPGIPINKILKKKKKERERERTNSNIYTEKCHILVYSSVSFHKLNIPMYNLHPDQEKNHQNSKSSCGPLPITSPHKKKVQDGFSYGGFGLDLDFINMESHCIVSASFV